MKMVDLHEAESQLARLVEEAAQSEWEGRVRILPDFDQTSEDVIADFEGRD